jgi:allantoate deiminase
LTDAETVLARCDQLAACSEDADGITRPFASGAMRKAHELVGAWMKEAGLEVRRDNIGNLRGRVGPADAPTLLIGSHLDSVRDAGKYDGPLGVMIAVAAAERVRVPYALEVLAFADEEGLRYGTTYLGSRAVTGTFDASVLNLIDRAGVPMTDAIGAFGGDPSAIGQDAWRGGPLLGYFEPHIEQGPVLEARRLPVGVVSAIAGQNRYALNFKGEAGHAGTVPMSGRRDALAAASEFVLAVEAEGRAQAGLVGTVGQMDVRPGAANVIPDDVDLSLDVRHAEDGVRLQSCGRLLERAQDIAVQRNVTVRVLPMIENAAVRCSPELTELLADAIAQSGHEAIALTSGAGHDGVVMASLTGIAMLFVRCKGGVSHSPAESVAVEDVAVAIDVTARFLELLAAR